MNDDKHNFVWVFGCHGNGSSFGKVSQVYFPYKHNWEETPKPLRQKKKKKNISQIRFTVV